jgi:predicted glycosyltransferase
MPDETRPSLVFYCQHSLGIGHLTRSFALVEALAEHFRVVFLNGGRLPPGVPVPREMERIDLPPLGMDDGHTVVGRGEVRDVAAAKAERRRLILDAMAAVRPAVLLVELFPFGRKKFADEILPMLRAARRQPGGPALVACSLRDILVDARPDQQRHDDRARGLADRYFDLVLVHSDERFATLGSSFRPTRPMRTPVVHTGYVVLGRHLRGTSPDSGAGAGAGAGAGDAESPPPRGAHLLVSAGGGIVGGPLFETVLTARERLAARGLPRIPLRLIAGPFLPEPQWIALQTRCAELPDVELIRHVEDMVGQMREARASISQCGYNTALDLVAAGVPALVVPYETATEIEQRSRAERLAGLGALQCLAPGALNPEGMATAIEQLLEFRPRPAALALDGAARSATILQQRLAQHRGGREAA